MISLIDRIFKKDQTQRSRVQNGDASCGEGERGNGEMLVREEHTVTVLSDESV